MQFGTGEGKMRNVVANRAPDVEDGWPTSKRIIPERGHSMGTAEHRRSERIMLSLPILVAGFDPSGLEFSEETRTLVVNREGALIALKHPLAPESTIRIINLQSDAAANFRVVGPTRMDTPLGTEWGVECLREGINIWGIDFAERSEGTSHASALLQCQECQRKFFWPVTLIEVEVLTSSGVIQNFCDHCRKPTPWTFADVGLRPQPLSSASVDSPSPAPQPGQERREAKRLLMKLPVLIRDAKGESEITKTENLSQGNLAVALAMDLAAGDLVTVVCPYTSTGRNLERTAKVLRREAFTTRDKSLYGLRYVAAGVATP
jgi:hypothetical protein